ncbi:MAG: AbrB/MazE/SpoVT family DNA-binding domain-containing protein [Janthinobacterium lividum]
MGTRTKLSSKGQVVLPKSLRERHGWNAGREFEIVENHGSVTLRPVVAPEAGPSIDDILDGLWAKHPYHGPKLTDDDMHAVVREMAAKNDARR